MQAIINATSKTITVLNSNDTTKFIFNPTQYRATIEKTTRVVNGVGMFNFITFEYGKVIGLPEPSENVYFIVMPEVKLNSTRPDLITPCDILSDSFSESICCKCFRI